MSVSDGQSANETAFNTAFASKTADNTISGIQALEASNSGDNVSNLQLEINNSKIKIQEFLSISGVTPEISIDIISTRQSLRVKGATAPVTMSGTPFTTSGGWQDGTEVLLIGMDDTNTVTLVNSDVAKGVIINGATAVLKKFYILTLRYDSNLDRWIEVGRNF